jgi:hypothetical protein
LSEILLAAPVVDGGLKEGKEDFAEMMKECVILTRVTLSVSAMVMENQLRKLKDKEQTISENDTK